jgi:hypothetical protein
MNTPNIPALPTGSLWTVAKNDLSWLQRHERIVIVALVLLVGGFLGNKALNYDASLKDAKVAALTQVVSQDKQNAAALALASSTAQQQYQVVLDAITKQNIALEASVAQMAAGLKVQQTADRALPLPAVASRIETLVPDAVGGITATTAGVVMNDTASHSVLTTLEEVPVLTDELKNETQVAANNKAALDSASTVIADKTAQVAGLNKSLTDQQAHEAAAVAAEKLKTTKAWKNGFKWGFAAGAALVGVLTHGL